jgi:hypothetical protein
MYVYHVENSYEKAQRHTVELKMGKNSLIFTFQITCLSELLLPNETLH